MKSKIKKLLKKLYFHHSINLKPISENLILATNKNNDFGYYFPYTSKRNFDYRHLHNFYYGYDSFLFKKYSEKNIQILSTDTVIDCGSFVGGFTISAVKAKSQKVYSIEPSSRNFNCLTHNIENFGFSTDKVIALNIGLGDKIETKKLNLSASGCDDSFLSPDDGDLNKFEEVEVTTLEFLIKKYNIDPSNLYLKVEAEGFEPEIIQGLGSVKPRVITVDVSPERNGESPRELIMSLLKEIGYENFTQTRRCLFAVSS